MHDVRAVILAGGMGTRLRPYTSVLPKPLMPVGEHPIIEILIRQLRHHGVRDISIAVGYLAPLLQAYCGDGSRWDVRISYSVERNRLGTAGPLSLMEGLTPATLVVNGDLLTDLDFGQMLAFHRREQPAITIASFDREERISLGVLTTDARGHVTEYAEKPVHRYQVSMGAYVIGTQALALMERGAYCDFPDLVRRAIAARQSVMSFRGTKFWLDIGRMDDYELAIERFDELRPTLLPGSEPDA